jgi:hypothetical protein
MQARCPAVTRTGHGGIEALSGCSATPADALRNTVAGPSALLALGLHDDRLVSAPLLLNFPLALIKLPDEQSEELGEGLFEQVLVEPPQAGPQLG